MGLRPICSAFCKTNRVCGMGPSKASTRRMQPSAMLSTRSTSPPKSECPGVSMMLILTSLYLIDTFFERIVMPRSRSRSLLSRMSSPAFWFLRKRCPASSILSTSVVLPWSTWAMMAMLRMSCILLIPFIYVGAKLRISFFCGVCRRENVWRGGAKGCVGRLAREGCVGR